MRCLFTMFAEDVELLPKGIFADALENRWGDHPDTFPGEVEELWRKMNEGGFLFGGGRIWRFNGGLVAEPLALPLNKHQLMILRTYGDEDCRSSLCRPSGALIDSNAIPGLTPWARDRTRLRR